MRSHKNVHLVPSFKCSVHTWEYQRLIGLRFELFPPFRDCLRNHSSSQDQIRRYCVSFPVGVTVRRLKVRFDWVTCRSVLLESWTDSVRSKTMVRWWTGHHSQTSLFLQSPTYSLSRPHHERKPVFFHVSCVGAPCNAVLIVTEQLLLHLWCLSGHANFK